MAESIDALELQNKISAITNSPKYKALSSSHRDAPQQREMDRMKLQLEGYRARLASIEAAPPAVSRRPTGSEVVAHAERPVMMARCKPGTRVTVPDEPKIVPRRGNAFVERRTAPVMSAPEFQHDEVFVPAAAPAPAGNSMPVRRARAVCEFVSAKRGEPDAGPIVTVISEPSGDDDADQAVDVGFSDLLE